MTPTEFLRSRNIVAKNKSDLMIGFDNGTEESLIELLETYHKSELNLLTILSISNQRKLLTAYEVYKRGEIPDDNWDIDLFLGIAKSSL